MPDLSSVDPIPLNLINVENILPLQPKTIESRKQVNFQCRVVVATILLPLVAV